VKKSENSTKDKILNNPDYIYAPRYKNSLKNIIESNPEGLDNKAIAKVLLITEEEVEQLYAKAVVSLQKALKKGL